MSNFLDAQPSASQARISEVLASGTAEVAVLLKMDFATTPLYISNRNIPFVDLQWGMTWTGGSGLLVGLPSLDTGEGDLAPFREYRLGVPDEFVDDATWRADLAALILDTAEYRGRDIGLYGQLFDDGQPLGYPFALDVGQMDKLTYSVMRGGTVVSLTAESLMARKGVPVYGMQTYFDQKRRYSTDEGLQFTTEANKLVEWTQW